MKLIWKVCTAILLSFFCGNLIAQVHFMVDVLNPNLTVNVTDSDGYAELEVFYFTNEYPQPTIYFSPKLVLPNGERISANCDRCPGFNRIKIPRGTMSCRAFVEIEYEVYYDFGGYEKLTTIFENIFVEIKNDQIPKDTLAPSLTSFVFLEDTIDITQASKVNSWVGSLTDQGHGIKQCEYEITKPSGIKQNFSLYYNYGTNQSNFSKSSLITRGEKPGIGRLSKVTITDYQLNKKVYDSLSLANAGINSSFTLINNWIVDTLPPIIDSIWFSDSIISIKNGLNTVDVFVRMKDSVGISDCWISLKYESNYISITSSVAKIFSGSAQSRVYKSTFNLSMFSKTGKGEISLKAVDSLGNMKNYTTADINNLNLPSTFDIIAYDTVPPKILSFMPESDTIYMQGQPQHLSIYIDAEDARSGVNQIIITFDYNDGAKQFQEFYALGGSLWYLDMSILYAPIHSPYQKVSITKIEMIDNAGNVKIYSSSDLEAIGVKPFLTLVHESALFLEFVKFDVESEQGKLLFNWTIESDENIKGYGFEFSENGIDWHKIGWLTENENQVFKQKQSLSHQLARNLSGYFRINVQTLDGKNFYSPIKYAQTKFKNSIIYPNPTQESLFCSHTLGNYVIQDLNGAKVQSGILNGDRIDISQLSAGVYSFVIAFKNEITQPQKFIKVSK